MLVVGAFGTPRPWRHTCGTRLPSIVSGRFLRPPDEEVARYGVERPLVKALRFGIAASSSGRTFDRCTWSCGLCGTEQSANSRLMPVSLGASVPDSAGPSVVALSGQELQFAIAQLDQAIYNHEQWYKNLVRVLVARLPPDASDLAADAHQRCRFGQWYDSDAVGALRDQPAFVALGGVHERMHGSATRLLQRVEDELPISAGDLDQFNNLLDQMHLELESLRRDLAETAQNRDPLTEARNRAGMLSDLREQHALVRRGLQECTLVMIDIDHFKDVNDSYGHAMGDAVLKLIAQCLQADMRPYDRLYRYGGEEFLLCSPQTSVAATASLAERLRSDVAELRIQNGAGGQIVQVTASFGVAALDGTRPVEEAIERADKAMYRAKMAGRDRVEVFGMTKDGQ
jgi:diguanylate cyclase